MKNLVKLLVVALLTTGSLFASGNGDLNIVSFKKAKGKWSTKSTLFLDARSWKLYQKGTIMGAHWMPTKKFKKFKKFLPANKAKTKIITFCNGFKCEESDHLARQLIAEGYKKVMVYKGGYPEWKEKGMPVMALVKECKGEKKGPYKPDEKRKINIAGVDIYEGGEEAGSGMIDQFWFANVLKSGKVPAGIQLVDIRKPSQYKEGHVKGAINVPWDTKAEKIDHTKFPKGKLIVFYCNTGMQSTDAKVSLKGDNGKNVLYFDAKVDCKGDKCTFTPNEN
jgi:rhodanese-related sulfurtransferase